MTPDELANAAQPLIADIGSTFYFDPETLAVGKEHGLDGYRFYFLGRGGVLGDVDAGVVLSAFGYFNPSVVEHLWNTGRERIDPRKAAELYLECNAELGRRALTEVDGLDDLAEAMVTVTAAIDPTGLALYAGYAAAPVPDDAPGKVMHLAAGLREARGSAHLVALVAHGVAPQVAHYLHRPDAWELFGYSADDTPDVTDDDRRRYAAAEETTTAIMASAFATLDDAGHATLLDGLRAVHTALGI